ncbi:MAG: 30S ribosome-binding factor RbfA [Nitrospirota bacterium]
MTQRTERINDLLRAELADLLRRKVKDPRVASASVTAVSTAPDLSQARVRISLLEPSMEAQTLAGLGRAAGFLRGELGRRLRLKRVPELLFEVDQTAQESARLDRLLDELEEERRA